MKSWDDIWRTCNSTWLLVSDGVRGDVEKNIFLSTMGDQTRQENDTTSENEGIFPGKGAV